MLETRVVIMCDQCGRFWDPAAERAACTETGQRVEIGCYGGHGRTGTALACLAVLCGQAPDEAVSWVRGTYCERAVETDEQEAFARNLTR